MSRFIVLWPFSKYKMECSACVSKRKEGATSVVFQTEEMLHCHIALEHVFWVPFECVLCPLTLLPTENVFKRHYEQLHPMNVPKATYTYVEEKKLEIQRILKLSKASMPLQSVSESGEFHARIETHSATLQDQKASRLAIKLEAIAKDIPPVLLTSSPVRRKSTNSPITSPVVYDGAIEMDVEIEEGKAATGPNGGEEHTVNSPHSRRPSLSSSPSPPKGQNSLVTPPEDDGVIDLDGDSDDEKERTNGSNETLKYDVGKNDNNPSSSCEAAAHPGTCRLCGVTLKASTLKARKYHLWRHHMPTAPFKCLHCDWKLYTPGHINTEGRTHSQRKHPELAESVVTNLFADNRPNLKQTLTNYLRQAFPLRQSEAKRQCNICHTSISMSNSGSHIWYKHLKQKRFQCQLCPFSSSSLDKMSNEHLRRVHGDRHGRVCWNDNTKRLQPKFRKAFGIAFGRYCRKAETDL